MPANGEEISVTNDKRCKKEMATESNCDENGVSNEWMNSQDANELRSQWYKKESEEENPITPKQDGKRGGQRETRLKNTAGIFKESTMDTFKMKGASSRDECKKQSKQGAKNRHMNYLKGLTSWRRHLMVKYAMFMQTYH